MTGDQINDGDIVVVDDTQLPGEGDIAIVHISNWHAKPGLVTSGWVLKRLREGGTVLESSNPAYPPMILRPENSPIVQGVVIGVVSVSPDGSQQARRIREPQVSGSLPVIAVLGELRDQLEADAWRLDATGMAPPEEAE